LKRAARGADAVASLLPEGDPCKATARAYIARLGNECGCAMGGAFMIAASVLVAGYAAIVTEVGVRLVVLGVGVVLVASMLGKLTGILIAVARLTVLRRRLGRRVARALEAKRHPVARGA
jgi:hypothetical protein